MCFGEETDQFSSSNGTVCDDGYFNCRNISHSGEKVSVNDLQFLNIDEDLPVFGKVRKIFVKDDVKIQFCVYDTIGYNSHLNAYEINEARSRALSIVFDKKSYFVPLVVIKLNSLMYTVYNSFQC